MTGDFLPTQWNRAALVLDLSACFLASSMSSIACGVPRGSVLGPILFLLYSAELQLLIENHGLLPHLYADDTQICGFCPLSASLTHQTHIAACIDDVAAWIRSSRLQLNPAKTDSLVSNQPSSPSAAACHSSVLVLTISCQPLSF